MIELKNISKVYPGFPPVLDSLSLSFDDGKVYCLMGESGSGKTTLLKLLAVLEEPTDGGLVVDGKISMQFQEDRLIEFLTPVQNISIATGIDDNAALTGLSPVLDNKSCQKPVSELSGGQKRRVALARAVLKNSDILLLDEPFTGLDDYTRRQCIKYILDNRNGRMLLVSTHNEEDAVLLGAEIIRLWR